MMLVIPSITTLQNQLEADARTIGISVVNVNKVRYDGGELGKRGKWKELRNI